MSKLSITTEDRRAGGGSGIDYTLLQLAGFIDAPNYLTFETALEKLLRANHLRLILDFRKVQYVNSTGISAIIRFHGALTEKGGTLLLTQVSRNVGLTMHLLGVTSIVPFLKDLAEAEEFLENQETAAPPVTDFELDEGAGGAGVKKIPVLVDEARQATGSVVLAVPSRGPFCEILRRRLSGLNGNYHIIHSLDEIQKNLEGWNPDLVVIDYRIPGVDDFIEKIKSSPRFSLTSVIVLYGRGTDVSRFSGFRVWENDYLVDPFDLMNLFVLTENELRRVPRDKRLFSQQVRFQFASDRQAVERGLRLANDIIQRLDIPDTETTALYAALKEAIDNAILHGNKHASGRTVTVNFIVDPSKITIMVEDEGEGFEYEYYLGQIDSEEAFERAKERIRAGGRGGLGILLMHKCSDRLEYSGSGNVVRIEKNLRNA
ncbi:MAG: ATP-binding protein [Planctomycetota bacterium]